MQDEAVPLQPTAMIPKRQLPCHRLSEMVHKQGENVSPIDQLGHEGDVILSYLTIPKTRLIDGFVDIDFYEVRKTPLFKCISLQEPTIR